jgi:predicted HD phosphohydrolase
MTARHIEDLVDLLNTRGGSADFGEPVSILEHSLQAAHSAEVAGAGPAAISAALLHDIGHMLHGLDEEIAHRGLDGMHEEIAAEYLARWFRAFQLCAPPGAPRETFRYAGTAHHVASARTTDVSTWRSGMFQYFLSSRSLSSRETMRKPCLS